MKVFLDRGRTVREVQGALRSRALVYTERASMQRVVLGEPLAWLDVRISGSRVNAVDECIMRVRWTRVSLCKEPVATASNSQG